MIKTKFLEFLKTKVYLGYQSCSWNPKMEHLIHSKTGAYYILDFYKLVFYLNKVTKYLKKKAEKRRKILFVGTYNEIRESIAKEARKSNSYFINYRWLGGTLTNWTTIRSRIKHLEYLKKKNFYKNLTKKEQYLKKKKLSRLKKDFNGIRKMLKLPDIAVILDQKKDITAVLECKKLNIPIISIVDSIDNPDLIDFPLPANLKSLRIIRFILKILSASIRRGRVKYSNNRIKI
uniref:Ribosomal protein S2 n=1 Tax=Nitzschia sp. NIES-3576 TaxID=2083273 RepID=A0A2Z5ZB81_9STRA|nr:ribosomal protein S2 [Nitzschia sp. NIES-3576]